MKKINKASVAIPDILTSAATISKRTRLLRTDKPWGKLSKSYTSPYKSGSETGTKLKSLYNEKCCFCEQKVRRYEGSNNKLEDNAMTVEHYRPKSTYRWLAYSWDNLMLCCNGCNGDKASEFPLEDEANRITFEHIDEDDLLPENIHHLGSKYNTQEQPKLPNPEFENPYPHLIFDEKGDISSNNPRYQYLIKTCSLQRLNIRRKKVFDKYNTEFEAIQIVVSEEKKSAKLATFVNKIKQDIKAPRMEFSAFRTYILINVFIPKIQAGL